MQEQQKTPTTSDVSVVYVYKSGGDTELRFSLRSLKNLPHRDVFIVGQAPKWVRNVTVIPWQQTNEPYSDTYYKIMAVARDKRVADNFVLFNDDFFLLKPVKEIQPRYLKAIGLWKEQYHNQGEYWKKIVRTEKLVGKDAKAYELHYPFPFNKANLIAYHGKYQQPRNAMLRTLYAHEFGIKGTQSRDYKAVTPKNFIKLLATNPPFISSSNVCAANKDWVKAMTALFQEPSPYELSTDSTSIL